jgi:hypothetical protein
VLRLGDRIDADDLPLVEGERCTSVGGVSVHANVAVPARDRRRLERTRWKRGAGTRAASGIGSCLEISRRSRKYRKHRIARAVGRPAPKPPSTRPAEQRPDLEGGEVPNGESRGAEDAAARSRRNLPWAELMRRVFAIGVLEWPHCGGPMRILAAVRPPETTRAILECLELPTRAPPTEPARPGEAEDRPSPGGLGGDLGA